MDAMPVVLIVKAPNQQIEDQTIHCELSWTIKKLKGYLSEVYPSKPKSEEQKLIYSGKLLHDNVVLKDVLRQYEGQETHTVHLVCTPSRDLKRRTGLSSATMINNIDSGSSDTGGEPSGSVENPISSASSEDLSQRLSSQTSQVDSSNHCPQPVQQTFPADPRAMWAAAMAQSFSGYDQNNPNTAQQIAWMQQAYATYISQYMQMMSRTAPHVPGNVPPAQDQQDLNGGNNQQNAPPVNQPLPQNAVNPAEREEEGGNPDLLDWFYFMSRMLVMFSIVYFYSSPVRFIMVSLFGVLMYLYQIGFFGPQNPAPRAAAAPLNNNNEPVNPDNNNEEESEQGNREAPEVNRPTIFTITWTFLSSFFASLIPEQPAAV